MFDVGWFWLSHNFEYFSALIMYVNCCTVDITFLKHHMGYKCVALITALKIILKEFIFVKTLVGKNSALNKTQSTRSCMKLYLKYH